LGLLAVFGIALILILNIENIIIGVYNLAVNAGYDLKFLSKTIRMMRESNTLNGRESIFSTTISGIAQAPVLGHGISTFYYYTGIEYPHNFILQMLYDIGFVGFSLVFIPFLFGIWRFCKACDSDSYLIGVLLFSASVPGALFSHDLWVNITLWATLSFFIGFATKNRDSFIRLRV
jgi:O-antigen ligase